MESSGREYKEGGFHRYGADFFGYCGGEANVGWLPTVSQNVLTSVLYTSPSKGVFISPPGIVKRPVLGGENKI